MKIARKKRFFKTQHMKKKKNLKITFLNITIKKTIDFVKI